MAIMKHNYYQKSAFILVIALHGGICHGIDADQQAFKQIVTVKKSFLKTNKQQQIKDLNYLASKIILYAAQYTASILKKDQYNRIYQILVTVLEKSSLMPTERERKAFRYAIESLVAQKDRPTNEREVNQELFTIDNNYKQVIKALDALHVPHDFPEYISTATLAEYAQSYKQSQETKKILLPYKNAFEKLTASLKNRSPQDIIDLKALAASILLIAEDKNKKSGQIALEYGPLRDNSSVDLQKVDAALVYVFSSLNDPYIPLNEKIIIIQNNYKKVISALNKLYVEHSFPRSITITDSQISNLINLAKEKDEDI